MTVGCKFWVGTRGVYGNGGRKTKITQNYGIVRPVIVSPLGSPLRGISVAPTGVLRKGDFVRKDNLHKILASLTF